MRLWQRLRFWWFHRNWRHSLCGLPALIAIVLVLGLNLAVWLMPQREVDASYLTHARSAFKNGNYERALTCYERLAQRSPESQEVIYELALTALKQGSTERTFTLMHELAGPDQQGYPPAHYWWAKQLFRSSRTTPEARDRAEKHLLRALNGDLEDSYGARALLGLMYFSKGRFEDAERELGLAVKNDRPHARLWLARLFAAKGEPDRAHREAELAANYFRKHARFDLTNHRARLLWAEAHTFLEQFPKAIAILEEGLAGTANPAYRRQLSRVYQTWFDMSRREGAKPERLLELVEKGLQYDPQNLALLDRLLAMMRRSEGIAPIRLVGQMLSLPSMAATGVPLGTLTRLAVSSVVVDRIDVPLSGEKARQLLRRMVARGDSLGLAHFALGVDYHQRGQTDEARFHWERAYKHSPNLVVAANNLAWLLAHPPNQNLPRALKMINRVIRRHPGNGQLLDTRGRILLRMGRYQEALDDLEVVLRKSKGTPSPSLHLALAKVHEKLGHNQMAAEHRQLARTSNLKQK